MSKIEWTHRPGTKPATLNPTTSCDKISRGCRNCYAEVMHKRLTGMGQPKYQKPFLGHVTFWPEELSKPFGWKKPRTVFLNSMSDIFHKDIKIREIAQIYAMMFLTSWHTYIVLTKRADRASMILSIDEFWNDFVFWVNNTADAYRSPWGTKVWTSDELKSYWPLKNVWQGVSVESQECDDRVLDLLHTPANIRVISYEPAVGPLDLNRIFMDDHRTINCLTGRWSHNHKYPHTDGGISDGKGGNAKINWVIAGSESGHNAAPAHPDWFRTVRDQCKAAGVAFFFKQWGQWEPDHHVSYNGPFSIISTKHYLVNIDGEYYPYGDFLVDTPKYTDEENKRAEECNLTKEDNAFWMANTGKKESGNFLDGKQHLEFPA